MILAVLDDLMFMSKIRSAAGAIGLDVRFAKSSAHALADVRAQQPALVIVDLDNPRTDPIATIAAIKQDAAVAGVPTLGFVSHVHADLVEAARRAGADQVLARSAFAAQLPEILAHTRHT